MASAPYAQSVITGMSSKILVNPYIIISSAGGMVEQNKHQAWYQETLALYTEVFDEITIGHLACTGRKGAISSSIDYKKNTHITPHVWLILWDCGLFIFII